MNNYEITQTYLDTFIRIPIFWDPTKSSKLLEFDDYYQSCWSTDSKCDFKTAISTEPLTKGERTYFEVKMIKGTNFKVGIASKYCNVEQAFSDSKHGWAYYSSGFLRHNSGGQGPKYGRVYKEGSVIGVYADLIDGRPFFSKDGVLFPVAYENKEFLQMELYPACCTLMENECF